jgi:peptidoglycan/LPS O-acetylase OafA/YrhL
MSLNQPQTSSKRLAWLEGLRIFAAVMILLYHAQLLITDYAFTPQPTGLWANLAVLWAASDRLGHYPLTSLLSLPAWFGFQFVDVFVLVSGFSLVLSLRGKPLETGKFLKRRFLRILWPFWTIAWLSYPVLWAIGTATSSYIPDLWHFFAAATFPLLFDYDGQLLLPINGPWWFVSLILSFAFIFPFLWRSLHRWGMRNLVVLSLLITLIYRTLAVYQFGGHPTYVIIDTPANWFPFLAFISKLSTFVLGIVAGKLYTQGYGPLFWKPRKALLIGIPLYAIGFVCQFYWTGWIFADLLLPLGLTLCCMAAFQRLAQFPSLVTLLLKLGAYSYSFFLIHNFVVDRTINLIIHKNLSLYYLLLPVMIAGTLLLAMMVDWLTPVIQKWVRSLLRDIDAALTTGIRDQGSGVRDQGIGIGE